MYYLNRYLSILAVLLFCNSQANASIQTFTSQATFNAATSGMSSSTEDFSSATTGLLGLGVAHNFGALTFTARADDVLGSSMLFYVADGFSGAEHAPFTTSRHLGWGERNPFDNSIDGSGSFGPTITIQFSSPQTAVSFDFLDSDGTDEYLFSLDGTPVSNFPATATSNDSAFFFGVVDNMNPFTTLTFSTPTTSPGGFVEEFGIDNIQFFAASSSNAIPEPSMFLVWAGLACCGTMAAKRRR